MYGYYLGVRKVAHGIISSKKYDGMGCKAKWDEYNAVVVVKEKK